MKAIIADKNGMIRTTVRFALEALRCGAILDAPSDVKLQECLDIPALDVLLIDGNFSDLDWKELIEGIHEKQPDVAVIIMSDSPTQATVVKAAGAGAAGFLVKPFTRSQVIDTVVSATQNSATQAVAPAPVAPVAVATPAAEPAVAEETVAAE